MTAWHALRAGEPERAMAHYASRGALHLSDTRDQIAENAAQAWGRLAREHHEIRQVAMIADAANEEIDDAGWGRRSQPTAITIPQDAAPPHARTSRQIPIAGQSRHHCGRAHRTARSPRMYC